MLVGALDSPNTWVNMNVMLEDVIKPQQAR